MNGREWGLKFFEKFNKRGGVGFGLGTFEKINNGERGW